MKVFIKFATIFVLLAVVFLPYFLFTPAQAATPAGLQQGTDCTSLVLGGTCSLKDGQTLSGGLAVIGGSARLESGSRVQGDIAVLGGTLIANGTIEGSVTVIGGLMTLGKTAVVQGDVNAISGQMLRDEGASIQGKVNTDISTVFPLIVSGKFQIPNFNGAIPGVTPGDIRIPQIEMGFNPFLSILVSLLRSFLWAALAVLVTLFLAGHAERTSRAALSQPLASGGLGCLTFVVAPLFLILLAITICGIPISLLGALALVVAWAFGVIALGLEVGRRIAEMFHQSWALPVSAAVGTFLLTLVVSFVGSLPCIGWLAPALVGVVALGAVLLTRFGSQDYPVGMGQSLPPNMPLPPPAPPLEIPPAMGEEGPGE